MTTPTSAPAPVVHSTTSGGVTATSAMTSQEIFNAHLQAKGGQPIDFKDGSRIGPPLHVHGDSVAGGVANLETAPAPAPSPTENLGSDNLQLRVAAEQNAREKIANIDAQLRVVAAQKELEVAPSTRLGVDPRSVDQGAVDKLNSIYRERMAGILELPESADRDTLEMALRIQFQGDMVEIMEGKRLGEQRADFRARQGSTTPAPSAPPPAIPAYDAGWQQHVVNGVVDISKLNTGHTSGYTLPRYVAEQTITVEGLAQLKAARAAGITQAQVDVVFRQSAIDNGWVKA